MGKQTVAIKNGGHKHGGDTVIHVLLSGKWVVLGIFLLAIFLAFVGVQLQTPMYRAMTTLQLELKRPRFINEINVYDGGMEGWGYFNTQIEVIRSRSLSQQVAEQIGWSDYPGILSFPDSSSGSALPEWLAMSADQRKAVVGLLQSGLRVEHVPNTQLIRIYFHSSHPMFAKEVTNLFAKTYIHSNHAPQLAAVERAEAWLKERLENAKQQLADSEMQLQQFRGMLGISTFEDERTELLEALNENLRRLREQQRDLIRLSLVMDAVTQAESDVTALENIPELAAESYVHSARESMRFAREDWIEQKMQDDATALGRAEQALKVARHAYEQELLRAAALIGGRYTLARQEKDKLQELVAEVRSALQILDRHRNQLVLLSGEVDANAQSYMDLLKRHKQLDSASGFVQYKAQVVEPAVVPVYVYSPDKSRVLTAAAFFGLLIAVAVLYLLYLFKARNEANGQ